MLDTAASLNEKIALERETDSNLNRTLPATSNASEVFEQCDARRKTYCLNHSLIKLCIHVHLRKKILSWISPIINNKDPPAKQVVFPFLAKPQYYWQDTSGSFIGLTAIHLVLAALKRVFWIIKT